MKYMITKLVDLKEKNIWPIKQNIIHIKNDNNKIFLFFKW